MRENIVVTYLQLNNSNTTNAETILLPDNTILFQNLIPKTEYKFKLYSITDGIETEEADFIVITPAQIVPEAQNLILNESGKDIVITWSPAIGIDTQKLVINGTSTIVTGNTASFVISNFVPGMIYNVSVIEIKGTDESIEISKSIQASQLQLSPATPILVSKTHNSITVNWNAVPGADKYILFINGIATDDTTDFHYTFLDLTPSLAYSISVKSLYGSTVIPNNGTLSVTTNALPVAELIENIRYNDRSQTSTKISFDLPSGSSFGLFIITFTPSSGPAIIVNSTVNELVPVTGLTPGASYTVTIQNIKAGYTTSTANSTYTSPDICSAPTGLSVAVNATQDQYTVSGTVGTGTVNFKIGYRLVGITGAFLYSTFNTLPAVFNIQPGQYEFEITKNCSNSTSTPVIIASPCQQVKDVGVSILGNTATILFRSLATKGIIKAELSSLVGAQQVIELNSGGINEISSLLPFTTYNMVVKHYCPSGGIIASDPVVFTTSGNQIFEKNIEETIFKPTITDKECIGCTDNCIDDVV